MSYVLTDPEESIEADGHPVGEQLLHHRLCSAERKHRVSHCSSSLKHLEPWSTLRPTVAASVWGSWPRTAPPGHWAEFWGCRWNTPVCHAAPPSAGRPHRPCLWVRRSAGSPECEWTGREKIAPSYPSAQNVDTVLKPSPAMTLVVMMTTLVRKSLLLSRLDSCTRPCSTVCRRHSWTSRSRLSGDSRWPGKKMRSAYIR